MHRYLLIFISILVGVGSGCTGRNAKDSGSSSVRIWAHQGQETEHRALQSIAAAFNEAHRDQGWRVELTFFPDFQFTEKIAIAAAAGDLPDGFEIDGPLLARYVDAHLLAPLDAELSASDRADFLPTILEQGTIDGRIYSLGAFDSAVVLYYDKKMFAAARVIPPAGNAAWTWAEFLDACGKLRSAGIEPLAMHLDESADEWFTYAFSPVIWSGGGELISADGRRVAGVLASKVNVHSLTAWQTIFKKRYAATDPVDPDPFGHDKVAMDWSGHWLARTHLEHKGARLGAMPLPRMGEKSVAPCGSWCWGISATTKNATVAAAWVRWVTGTDTGIIPMVRANGAVPARRSAFAAFPEYANLPYRLFREQLEHNARPRPHTPFYATLTRHFAGALRDIARGADPATRLSQAENEVQKVIDRRLGSSTKEAR